jgi:preprotein translocase subunit SecF
MCGRDLNGNLAQPPFFATMHDVLTTVGLLALLGREFNLVEVAALLTLAGLFN